MSFVTLEHRGPVGLITMNRPEALNALNDQVLRDLDAVLDQVEADPDCAFLREMPEYGTMVEKYRRAADEA